MRHWRSILVAAALLCVACPERPTPLPPKDVVTASACVESCSRLKELACPEGDESDCVSSCEKIASLGYVWTSEASGPKCVVKAGTVEQVRKCNVKCKKE